METDVTPIPLTESTHAIHLASLPAMPAVFFRILAQSLAKQSSPPAGTVVQKVGLHLSGFIPDPRRVRQYRRVCGFDPDLDSDMIPPSFLQTLFIGLLGRYVTSPFFPLNPMGLIQTGQEFESIRPVYLRESLDLSCTLLDMTRSPRGITTRHALTVTVAGRPAWTGLTAFLTRNPSRHRTPTTAPRPPDVPLPRHQVIPVPADTGRRYARVSGDYNPHHLTVPTARMIGFNRPIAHGMWSLARGLAALTPLIPLTHPCRVTAAFKRPLFMPGAMALGHDATAPDAASLRECPDEMAFELRDAESGVPHLKARVTCPAYRG